MRLQLLLVDAGLLAAGFLPVHVPIQWMGFPAGRFVMPRAVAQSGNTAPRGVVAPQELMITDRIDRTFHHEVPLFSAKPDSTITLDATGWCIEANGVRSGDAVRLNHCTGAPTQLWEFLPCGPEGQNQIRMKGTGQCLAGQERDLDRAPLELRECENAVSERWTFAEPISLLSRDPSSRPAHRPMSTWDHSSAALSSARHVMICSAVLIPLLPLAFSAWLWLGRAKTSAFAASRRGDSLHIEHGGVSLAAPLVRHQGFACGYDMRQCEANPAIMVLTSTAEGGDHSIENQRNDETPEPLAKVDASGEIFNLASGAFSPEALRAPLAQRRSDVVMSSSTSVSALSAQLKEMRSSIGEDTEAQQLMESLRGKSLNTDETAAEGLNMRLVEVERGEDELPLRYDPAALEVYFSKRPGAVMRRISQVVGASSGLLSKAATDILLGRAGEPAIQLERAADLREVVTSLGPFFIKIGQALSIRPDILPPQSMVELQKLCDKVPSFDSELAMKTIINELGDPDELFSELTSEPIAAASLGQVYKGKLRSTGETVAVKVQRPFVLETVSLDLYLIRKFGMLVKLIPNREERTDLVALVDEFAGRFYDELDYRIECENGVRIAEHMSSLPKVKIPKCYPDYTSRRVHTAEWVDGEKLAQSRADDVQDLVNVGVVAYLTQLLGAGFFHADPHPGNMIRTPDGNLCILDFGLMTELTDDQKYGIIESIVHLINRDYQEIGDDFKKLDFIPKDVNVEPIVPALTRVFDAALAGGGAKSINFNDLAADLAQITFDYPFRLPPYFALVIRAIGVLEGIALVGNPEFAIIDEAFPYISQRLLTDESPRLRDALRYMVYGRQGIFDAERLIDLLKAFENFDVVRVRAGGDTYNVSSGTLNGSAELDDEEAERVSTALSFFFSPEGSFLRTLLLDESSRGVDLLSRSALRRLRDQVPFLKLLVPSPVRLLVPKLTPEEENSLRSTEALLEFFLSQTGGPSMQTPGNSMSKTARTVQRWRPILQQYSTGMNQFGFQIAQRISDIYASRFIRSLASQLRA